MRKRAGLTSAGAAFLILATSVAWACTKQAELIGLTPQSAAPFTEIRVDGRLLAGSSAEIKWNSLSGQTLRTLTPADADINGNFAVAVTIPSVPPGIYSVVVTGPDYGVARAAVEVVAGTAPQGASGQLAAGNSISGDLWNGVGGSVPGQAPHIAVAAERAGMVMWGGMLLLAAGLSGIILVALTTAGKRRTASRQP